MKWKESNTDNEKTLTVDNIKGMVMQRGVLMTGNLSPPRLKAFHYNFSLTMSQ